MIDKVSIMRWPKPHTIRTNLPKCEGQQHHWHHWLPLAGGRIEAGGLSSIACNRQDNSVVVEEEAIAALFVPSPPRIAGGQ